ncbi:autophagy protein 13 [Actinomortierella ambigua]|nr:autophagy protein 13 [Actinomortierella ambigua]
MSRHSSISSYYQPSSRSASPGPSPTQSTHGAHMYSHQQSTSGTGASPYSQLYPYQQQHQQHQGQHQQQQQQQQQQHPPPPPRNQKADQILQNFYVKVIQIVLLARVTHPDPLANQPVRKGSLRGAPLVKKTSKWFNLELEDLEIYKDDAKFWRAAAITESPPMMVVELFLDTSEMSPNQVLVLIDENNQKNRIDIHGNGNSGLGSLHPYHRQQHQKTRKNILIESWSLTLGNTLPEPVPEPPVVYKKSIIFFRSLYAYMRLLPAYQLYRRLRKQNHSLKIGFRVSRGHQTPEDSILRSDHDIGIEVPLVEGETRPMITEYRFGQVETPVGSFSLNVTYRSNVDFHVDESETLLSSRFIDMDENYFKPTVAAHSHSQESIRSLRQYASEAGTGSTRRSLASQLTRRPSQENSGLSFSENLGPTPALRPRRNSAQSLKQHDQPQHQYQQHQPQYPHRSGEFSSSQSSLSSIGTRMSRRGSSGAPIGGGAGAAAAAAAAAGGVGVGGFYHESPQYSQLQHPSSVGTPPFSVGQTGGGYAAVAKHHVDPIMESPPFKLGTSHTEASTAAAGGAGAGAPRRPLSAVFSPFKSPSLSSSPSPSYLEAIPQPSGSSSRPASIHLHRSPSSSSMNRYPLSQGSNVPTSKQQQQQQQQAQQYQQQAQQPGSYGSGGGATGTSLTTTGGAFVPGEISSNLLSTSVKSNASSASIPRVTSSFGHRHDSTGRRASSESLPPGRSHHRNSIVGTSSLFQFTQDEEDDVSAFVRMLDSPEPLKLFGKLSTFGSKAFAAGSGGSSGSDAGSGGGESSMMGSAHRSKTTLDRFQKLKHMNSNLSESMSASQTLGRQQQQSEETSAGVGGSSTGGPKKPLVVDIAAAAAMDPTSSAPSTTTNVPASSSLGRYSQAVNTHQPGTPSPLHAQIPIRSRDVDDMIVPRGRERRTSTSSNLSVAGGSSPHASHSSSRLRSSEGRHSRTVSEQSGVMPTTLGPEDAATAGGSRAITTSEATTLSRPQPIVNKRHSLTSVAGGGGSGTGLSHIGSTTSSASSRSPGSTALIMDEIRRGTRSPFRHGSLDQERDAVGSMERAMAKVQLRERERASGLSKSPGAGAMLGASPSSSTTPAITMTATAYGSYPEEGRGVQHHDHQYHMHPQAYSSATGSGRRSVSESTAAAIKSTSVARSGSPTGVTSGSSRSRKVSTSSRRYGRGGRGEEEEDEDEDDGRKRRQAEEEDEDDEDDEYDESLRTANNTVNDDDDMLFIMSELSPGASGAAATGRSHQGGVDSAEILSSRGGYDLGTGSGGYGSGASSMASSRGHPGGLAGSGLVSSVSSSRRNSRYGVGGGAGGSTGAAAGAEGQPSMAALLLGTTSRGQHGSSASVSSASSSSASSPRLMPIGGGAVLYGPSATPLEHPITMLGSSRRSSTVAAAATTTTTGSSRHPSPTLGAGGSGSPASISRPGSVVGGGAFLARPASRSGAGDIGGAFALGGSAFGPTPPPPPPSSS